MKDFRKLNLASKNELDWPESSKSSSKEAGTEKKAELENNYVTIFMSHRPEYH